MRRAKRDYKKVCFISNRLDQQTRDWFNGTMMFTRHNPRWFVRIFEIHNNGDDPAAFLGKDRPDAIISCGVPVKFITNYLAKHGRSQIPILAFPESCSQKSVMCVQLDFDDIAHKAVEFFKQGACEHIAYIGAHSPRSIRSSRGIRIAFEKAAKEAELPFNTVRRKVYEGVEIRVSEMEALTKWLIDLPKPCGILTFDDAIGRDILDICRWRGISVPADVCVLGIGNSDIVCENVTPTLSSIRLNRKRSAFLACKTLDDLINGSVRKPKTVLCGVESIIERASTRNSKSPGQLLALARDYINKHACQKGGISQVDVAHHFGVSVRTLQMRFHDAAFSNTILHEIRKVQIDKVCKLLSTTDMPIGEITYACGFRSLSRLKAVFQDRFGMNMRDWRRKNRVQKTNPASAVTPDSAQPPPPPRTLPVGSICDLAGHGEIIRKK